MKYLTARQYQAFDDGVASSDVNAFALAGYITRAEAAIDAHMGFDPRLGGFEAHQCWFEHKWDATSLRSPFPNRPVPVRNIVRYRIQTSNLSTSGAGYFATIAPTDATINEFDDYVEIVPLQSVTYSLTPLLLAYGLKDPIVQEDLEIGYFLPYFGDTLYDSGDHKTYYAMRGFWAQAYTQAQHVQPNTLPPIPPIIYKNGAVVSSGNYSINGTEGSVVFTVANVGTDVITADYTATIPDEVQAAAVAQVSYLLAKRALNKAGLYDNLQYIMNGDQRIQRPVDRGKVSAALDVLCPDGVKYLSRLVPIGIAG